jgi:hypothetical protein
MVIMRRAREAAPYSQYTRGYLRYQTCEQHDISRCERGLSPILGAVCRCGGTLFGKKRDDSPEFFASLPASDLHSFQYGGQLSPSNEVTPWTRQLPPVLASRQTLYPSYT